MDKADEQIKKFGEQVELVKAITETTLKWTEKNRKLDVDDLLYILNSDSVYIPKDKLVFWCMQKVNKLVEY